MKPRVAIGITTYRDLSGPEIGVAVYDALAEASPRTEPKKGEIWGVRHDIESRETFAERWLTLSPYEMRSNRGKGPVVGRGTYRIGLEWRSPAGTGQLQVRPEIDPNCAETIELDYVWSPRIDWATLFDQLVEITQPAYAMLHLFTERELESYPAGERLDRFEGPVAGEGCFTGWLSSVGEWRGPDRHRPEERRQYRFLPQLSWANVLGREFEGRYDPQAIDRLGVAVRRSEGRTSFRVTESLRNVERNPEAFEAARLRLREAFAPDFFRR